MWKNIKLEQLKLRHTFGGIIAVISPIITVLLALAMTDGLNKALPAGAWNWWYIMLLPGTLSILCYLVVKDDKKLKYQNIFLVEERVEKGWLGKIVFCSYQLLISNMLIFICTLIGGVIFGSTITVQGGFIGAILLSIGYLWEIPLYMYLSAKFGLFACVFSSMVLSVGGVVTLSDSEFWWLCPSSIPVRLMCPPLGILPNGLPIPLGSELHSWGVVVPGIVLSIIWFLAMTYITALWFSGKERK